MKSSDRSEQSAMTEVEDLREPSRRTRSRRHFLKGSIFGGLAACATTGSWAFLGAPHNVEVVRVLMPLRNLPESLVGKTIVQISDLHVGPIVSRDYLRDCLELVSSLEPDVVAITGDFVTYDGPARVDEAVSLLADIQPGKLATVAITGNHDFGSSRGGFANRKVADSLTEKLNEIGIRMLRNTAVEIEGLRLLGVDDFWGPTHELSETLSSGNADQPSVMLCHNPDFVDQPGWENYRGWILSGHTHGGQVRLPFCKPPILPIRNHDYTAGKVKLPGDRTLYVNRGLGYLRKVRLNVRPEITVFSLSRAA
jgi:predicted MPP superfamily phosphohydrolase